LVFFAVLAGIMIPPQVLIVPLFREMVFLGLVDTYWGLILPQLALPIAVIIFKTFFDGLPVELEEAAIVDGASRLRVFRSIVVPLSRPVISAVSVFVAIIAWNNFLWPFIVITNPNMMTIPVGLATVEGNYGIQYAQLMAAAVLGGLPLLIVFVFFQRQIVQGIASTGTKG
jgi:multiple sugar transport system permease protein